MRVLFYVEISMRSLHLFLYLISTLVFYPQLIHATYFKNIGIKDGLSQLSVVSMHQDVLGRIWFGTVEGLSIYDGWQITTLKGGDYLFDEYIKGNSISNIVENTDHDIYFNADGAFIEYKIYQNKFKRIRESGVTSVSAIQGKIYITVQDSILLWDEREEKLHFFMKTVPKVRQVYSVFEDSASTWWIATNDGLYKKNDTQWDCIIPGTHIWGIYESRAKELWIATDIGVYRIDTRGNITRFVHEPDNPNSLCCDQVRKIVEDREGCFWIGTFKGLNKYSPKENKFEVYVEGSAPGNLRHSSIHSLMLDNQGDIWVGTYYGGVSVFAPGRKLFSYYPADLGRAGRLDFHMVGQMVEDKRHNLWICTDGGGLNFMDRETAYFYSFDASKFNIRSDNLKSICYDSIADKLYFALYRRGITCYDITTRRFSNCLKDVDQGYSHRNVRKVSMYNGQLLFLSESGAFLMNPRTSEILPLLVERNCQAFLIDSKEYLWVLHMREVIRMNLHNKEDVKRYSLKAIGLGNYDPLCITEAVDGNIYIGIQGAGILEYDNQTDGFHVYTARQNDLLSDYCYSMVNSKYGMLVLLGDKGLSFFNIQTKKVDYVVMTKNLPISAFNDGNGLLVTENGDIFAGSTDGLIMFSEDEIRASGKELSLYFSTLHVNNVQVTPGDKTGILKQILGCTKEVVLNYKQNNLVFTFANNGFGIMPSSPFYEYKLEGFDKEWVLVDNPSRLTYTNLNPGEYTLKVREVNRYGNKTDKEIQLAVIINPPFYNTPLAWIIYILCTAIVAYVILSGRQQQMILKNSLENEKREKENIEQINRFKLNFFTNISHELRTPLTLIITQAEMLLSSQGVTNVVRNRVGKLHKNASYMYNLINELLDFHKLEQKQIRLKVSLYDIVPFLNEIYLSFKEKAIEQDVSYKFVVHGEVIPCWFDAVQLRKVFFNLLSNAFKYTRKGGTVEMLVSGDDDECTIRVVDTGIGIAQKDLDKIFERFYQTMISRDVIGSGIGLALSKEIVELHHGEISVESKVGYGSIFIVKLKQRKECLSDDPNIEFLETQDMDEETTGIQKDGLQLSSVDKFYPNEEKEMEEETKPQEGNERGDKYTILIVEDDKGLLSILDELFSGLYCVLKARNGKEGWNMIQKEHPNIVLSDVMMPEMGGLELCMKIKNNIQTSHIPVILLTAAGSSEQQIEGLKTGADDYMAKPFNSKILLLKVGTILRNRSLLKETLGGEVKTNIELLAKSEQEQRMLQNIENIIEKHLDDAEFDIDQLGKELGISRSATFKKVKALTGVTPSDFILGYRLKKAAMLLLEHSELQMEDIALQLGFSSGRYFSKCFKKYFNISPLQYRKQNNV